MPDFFKLKRTVIEVKITQQPGNWEIFNTWELMWFLLCTLIDDFIQKLTKIGTLDGCGETKYIDNSNGIQTCNKKNVILIAIKKYIFWKSNHLNKDEHTLKTFCLIAFYWLPFSLAFHAIINPHCKLAIILLKNPR